MLEIIKNTMFAGIGLASLSKEKAEKLVKDLTKAEKISEREGREFVDDLLKKSENVRKEIEGHIEKAVKKRLRKMNLVTRDDLQHMEKQIEEIKSLLAKERNAE